MGQSEESIIEIGIGGQPMIDQLNDNMIMAEQCRQPVQLRCRCGSARRDQRLSDGSLATAGQDHPMVAGLLRQLLDHIAGPTFFITSQLSFGDSSSEPVISLDAPGEHQKMLTLVVGYSVLWGGQSKRELGAVDSAQVVRESRLGEA